MRLSFQLSTRGCAHGPVHVLTSSGRAVSCPCFESSAHIIRITLEASRILIVEDETALAHLIERVLREEGYATHTEFSGEAALAMVMASEPDCIVLDVGLPDIDGLHVCSLLRERGFRTPIIILTARDAVPDRVRGLDSGADDYLVKPFSFDELLARIRAHLRRTAPTQEILAVGDISLDPSAHAVFKSSVPVELTDHEFRLLEMLMRHTGKVLSRQQLLDYVWGYGIEPNSNVVDLYIYYLRKKLDTDTSHRLIQTVRGAGYKIEA